jgi:hypothetical protein
MERQTRFNVVFALTISVVLSAVVLSSCYTKMKPGSQTEYSCLPEPEDDFITLDPGSDCLVCHHRYDPFPPPPPPSPPPARETPVVSEKAPVREQLRPSGEKGDKSGNEPLQREKTNDHEQLRTARGKEDPSRDKTHQKEKK